jgi:hypothetical protein
MHVPRDKPMRVLAFFRPAPERSARAHLRAEVAWARSLPASKVLVQIVRPGGPGAVLILEVGDADAARQVAVIAAAPSRVEPGANHRASPLGL